MTLEQKQYSQFLSTGIVDLVYVNSVILKNYILCFASLFVFDTQQNFFASSIISKFLIFD